MTYLRNFPIVLMATLAAASGFSGGAQAQGNVSRSFETRAQLEAAARQAEASKRAGEAALIRTRLDRGDFQAGDRVLVTVEGPAGFTDTLMVEAGPKLPIPQLGELPLAGVLRSELLPRLKAHVANYLKIATVRANPMVRIAVLGNVSRPGFYYTFADVPISDALMAAGGPTGQADVGKVEVTRGAKVIASRKTMRSAMSNGLSIDALHMRAGDEIHVGSKRQITGAAVSITAALLGITAAIVTIAR